MPARLCALCREPISGPVDFHAGKPAHKTCVNERRAAARQQSSDATTSSTVGPRGVSTGDLRRAEEQARRNRDRILRGDSFRIGGRDDAPDDRALNAERHQNREYVQRGKPPKRRRRSDT